MTDRGPAPMDHPAFEASSAAGMYPYACSYTKDGDRYGITLFGCDPESVVENNCDVLENLKVDGVLDSVIPADNTQAWAIIDAYEKRGS